MISRKERHGDCTFVVISDIGESHHENRIPNQDAADYFIIDDDFAMAVSDGVGSCINAEKGSSAAVLAIRSVFAAIQGKREQANLSTITKEVIQEWDNLLAGDRLDDCCATLKAVMKLGCKLLLFSIGDGLLAVSSDGIKVCAPMKSALFSNQTMCLNAAVKATDFWTSEFNLDTYIPYVVFACSDGVANGIQEGREMELVSEIENVTSEAELQTELETLLYDISEFSSDDRTVGVVKYERKNAKSNR